MNGAEREAADVTRAVARNLLDYSVEAEQRIADLERWLERAKAMYVEAQADRSELRTAVLTFLAEDEALGRQLMNEWFATQGEVGG